MGPPRLIAEEEKELVLTDGPTEAQAELIALELRLARLIEKVAGIEIIVAMEIVDASLVTVRPGLADDMDLPAGVAAILGAVSVGLDAKLANGFEPERSARSASRRA